MKKRSGPYSAAGLLKDLLGLLPEAKSRRIRERLKTDPKARAEMQKAGQLKKILDSPPLSAYNESVDKVWEMALQREKELSSPAPARSLPEKADAIIQWLFKFRLRLSVASLLIVAALSSYFLLRPAGERAFVTMAYGDLTINGRDFFKRRERGFDLSRGIVLQNRKGASALQINDSKLIIVRAGSDIRITRSASAVRLDLREGGITASVRQKTGSPLLEVKAGEALYVVTGTKFSVTRNGPSVLLAVQEGRVKALWNERSCLVSNGNALLIQGAEALLRRLDKNDEGLFRLLANTRFIRSPGSEKGLFISTGSLESRVYDRSELLGTTPYFCILSPDSRYDLSVQSAGHVLRELSEREMRQGDLPLVLKKDLSGYLSGKFSLPVRPAFEPEKKGEELTLPGEDGSVYKYDLRKNRVVWKHDAGDAIGSRPLIHRGRVFIMTKAGTLQALDHSSGRLIWKTDLEPLVYSGIMSGKGRLYIAGGQGLLFCLDQENGAVLWSKKFPNAFYSPLALKDGRLYAGNLNGYFYAFDLKEQKIAWGFKTMAGIVGSGPVIREEMIFFGSTDRFLYALNRKDGSLAWKFMADSPIFTSPEVLDDMVIITSSRGFVYACELGTGRLLWSRAIPDSILSDPMRWGDRHICIGDKKDKSIYVFNRHGMLFSKLRQDFILCKALRNDLFIVNADRTVRRYILAE